MYEDESDWRIPDWFWTDHKRYSLFDPDQRQIPSRDSILSLRELIETNPDEKSVQHFLERNLNLFYSFMRTGHGNWVFPRLQLGKDFIPDFLYCAGNSGGPSWRFLELESSVHTPFLKSGQFSQPLRTAVDQIRDWRRYVDDNGDTLRKPRSQGGQGLFGLRSGAFAKIVIGRRKDSYPERYQALRREIRENESIEIVSHDTFVDDVTTRWEDYYVHTRGQQSIEQP